MKPWDNNSSILKQASCCVDLKLSANIIAGFFNTTKNYMVFWRELLNIVMKHNQEGYPN